MKTLSTDELCELYKSMDIDSVLYSLAYRCPHHNEANCHIQEFRYLRELDLSERYWHIKGMDKVQKDHVLGEGIQCMSCR